MGTVVSSKNMDALRVEKKTAAGEQDRRQYSAGVIKEETGRLVNYFREQFPREVLIRIEGKGGLREKIGGCIGRNFYNIIDNLAAGECGSIRYTLAGEKEGKRLETSDITAMVNSAGETAAPSGPGEPVPPPRGRLFVINELETYANSILKRKSGGETAAEADSCSVVRCVFRDNGKKPQTVTDLALTVNSGENALLGTFIDNIIADIIGSRIITVINNEIAAVRNDDSGRVFSSEEIDALADTAAGCVVTAAEAAALLRGEAGENAKMEMIRDGGFALAVTALQAILRSAKLDYRLIEHQKSCRELVILEYEGGEGEDSGDLPDERYGIRLRYLDGKTLAAERKTRADKFARFENDIRQLRDLLAVLYEDSKPVFRVTDFDDLAKKNKGRLKELAGGDYGLPGGGEGEAGSTVPSRPMALSGGRRAKMAEIRAQLVKMRERLRNMYDFLNPVERDVAEQRLSLLEGEYAWFDNSIDPHDLDCGLVIDMDVTSIKRRKTTLEAMAAVLGEFLENAPECFREAAKRVFDRG